jgi:hypothetical protein
MGDQKQGGGERGGGRVEGAGFGVGGPGHGYEPDVWGVWVEGCWHAVHMMCRYEVVGCLDAQPLAPVSPCVDVRLIVCAPCVLVCAHRENLEGEYSGLEHEVVDGVVESLKVKGGLCGGAQLPQWWAGGGVNHQLVRHPRAQTGMLWRLLLMWAT